MAALVYICTIIFLYFPCVANSASIHFLPLPAAGPESFAFDFSGNGPYTTVVDGRILKYQGPDIGFVEYAFTSPTRTGAICDGTNSTATFGQTCGRPLGLEFYHQTGELYVVDGFYGLLVVRPNGGGLATQLATSAEGVPFGALDGIEVDQRSGVVYFTDTSSRYGLNQAVEAITSGDSTGRLLRYDPQTRNVTVLMSGLRLAAGVALSADRSYLLVTEYLNNRIHKYWLKGPKANTSEILVTLTGSPNKVRRMRSGDFWVAVTVQTPSLQLTGIRMDGFGNISKTITFSPEFDSSLITEVYEYKGTLFLGSFLIGHVGVYRP
jgi:sugar lactone lactonase YvrE